MKITSLLFLLCFTTCLTSYAQLSAVNSTAAGAGSSTDVFTHNGYSLPEYSLGWYYDQGPGVTPTIPPFAYFSAFGGIKFFTATTPRVLFDSNGNVGIGTMSPNAKLHLWEDGGLGATAFKLTNRNNTQTYGVAVDVNTVDDAKFMVYNANNNTPNLVIDNVGNIGIGTESPVSLFQVDDGCTKASIGDASGTAALNYGTSYLGFNASRSGTGSTSSWLTNGDGINNGGGVMYSSIFGDMYFAIIPRTGGSGQTLSDVNIASNIAMKINHNDGAVYAKKIYVQLTGFPDYVFNRDYQLMPLAQVKSYIDQNHHLPEMPTEKEVETKGLDVGEMNKLLTKKVEELTLYLIDLKAEKEQKEREQETLIKNQESRLKLLEEKLEKIISKN